MSAHAKNVGTAKEPATENWMAQWPELMSEVRFSVRPRKVQRGDRLVYYAVGKGRFVAICEVTSSEPIERKPPADRSERWPWKHEVKILAAIAATGAAPRPQDVGINPQRVIRPSHSELTQQEYERIAAALADVVRSV